MPQPLDRALAITAATKRLSFLYGGYTVPPHVPLPTRSEPAAVLKLCESGGSPTMKFSDGADGRPGPKSSKPGRPVLWRLRTPDGVDSEGLPMGVIGQEGEEPATGYEVLTGAPLPFDQPEQLLRRFRSQPSANSPATAALLIRCTRDRDDAIARAL